MYELTAPPITRRKSMQLLLGFAIVSTIGGVLIPIISYLLPREANTQSDGPATVGNTEDFPLNSGTVVSVDNKPVMVVNTKAGGIKAFSAICTHLGCIAEWNQRKGVIHCPCHDGLFNPVTGEVVSGPPPRGLPLYELAVKDDKVIVGKPLGQIYGS